MAAITSKFDPTNAVGDSIIKMTPKQVCELCSGICVKVRKTVGDRGYMGGIYPSNISCSESGLVTIGPDTGEYSEEQADFMAPELYWKGEKSPAADVYSIGMLLVYASFGGKLPFEKVFNKEIAREHRMNGDKFYVPERLGKRVSEIATRATAYNPADRFTDVTELKSALESCISKLTKSGDFTADVFNKSNIDDLSPVEKMMLGIVNDRDAALDTVPEPSEEKNDEQAEEQNTESYAGLHVSTEVQEIEEVTEESTETIIKKSQDEANKEIADEIAENLAGIFENDRSKPKNRNLAAAVKRGSYVPEDESEEEREERLAPAVSYTKKQTKKKPVKKEDAGTRASLFILISCLFLVIAAIIFNTLTERMKERLALEEARIEQAKINAEQLLQDVQPEDETAVDPDGENTPVGGEPQGTENVEEIIPELPVEPVVESTPEPTPVEHRYELIVKDVTWREAAEECRQRGGYLATIGSVEELQEIIAMCEAQGIYRVWIGCHRENGELVWEGPNGGFYQWGRGEPSGYDYNDNVSEDYVLLWKLGDWVYNDSRNDPVGDYPGDYSGKIGYICEYGE